MCGSIYMRSVAEKLTHSGGAVLVWGWGWRWGTFWAEDKAPHLNCGGSYSDVCVFQKPLTVYVFSQHSWEISGFQGGPRGDRIHLPVREIWGKGSIPGSGRSSEEGMAAHSSILAWRIPGTEEPGGLHSTGSHKELDMTEQLSLFFTWRYNRKKRKQMFSLWWKCLDSALLTLLCITQQWWL